MTFADCCKGDLDTYLQVINAQTAALLQNERNGMDILRRPMDASVLSIKHSAEAGALRNYRKKRAGASKPKKGAKHGVPTTGIFRTKGVRA
jgi:hypothetical protein